jgi:hypothetical protein
LTGGSRKKLPWMTTVFTTSTDILSYPDDSSGQRCPANSILMMNMKYYLNLCNTII